MAIKNRIEKLEKVTIVSNDYVKIIEFNDTGYYCKGKKIDKPEGGYYMPKKNNKL